MRSLAVGVTLTASGIAVGLVGGLLSAYWWDFPPEDMERYGHETVALDAALGVIGGLVVGGLLIAMLEVRGRGVP